MIRRNAWEGSTMHHRIVIIGGGSAGISVAARLRRAGEEDVAVIEPAGLHYYQPLWPLVGGGVLPVARSRRLDLTVMPKVVRWVQDGAAEIDPDARIVVTAGGA